MPRIQAYCIFIVLLTVFSLKTLSFPLSSSKSYVAYIAGKNGPKWQPSTNSIMRDRLIPFNNEDYRHFHRITNFSNCEVPKIMIFILYEFVNYTLNSKSISTLSRGVAAPETPSYSAISIHFHGSSLMFTLLWNKKEKISSENAQWLKASP